MNSLTKNSRLIATIAKILLDSDTPMSVDQILNAWPKGRHRAPMTRKVEQLMGFYKQFVRMGSMKKNHGFSDTSYKVALWTHYNHSMLNEEE